MEEYMSLELFKGKVVCPRCDGNGLIYKLEYQNLTLYICDECEATWENFNVISVESFADLQTFLELKGLKYLDIIEVEEDYYWYIS